MTPSAIDATQPLRHLAAQLNHRGSQSHTLAHLQQEALLKGSPTSCLKQLSIPVRPAPDKAVIRPVPRVHTPVPAPGTGREGVDPAYLKGQEMAGRGGSRENRVAGSTHHLPKNTKALGSLSS